MYFNKYIIVFSVESVAKTNRTNLIVNVRETKVKTGLKVSSIE